MCVHWKNIIREETALKKELNEYSLHKKSIIVYVFANLLQGNLVKKLSKFQKYCYFHT